MCENCKILTVRCVQYETENNSLKRSLFTAEERILELINEIEELEVPEESYSETRRQMLEDRD